jgi:hypothetical protein
MRKVFLLMLIKYFVDAQFDKIRLLDNYVCDGTKMPVELSLSSVNWSQFTIGFWIKVPFISSADNHFIGFYFNANAVKLGYSIKTTTLSDFGVFQGMKNLFSFTGGNSLDLSNSEYILRSLNNTWHYFIFTFRDVAAITEIIATADIHAGYLTTENSILSTLFATLIIGGDVSNVPCGLQYQIHKVDLIAGAFNVKYGAQYLQTKLFSLPGGAIRALYLQNQNIFAYYLNNAIDPLIHKAKVIDTRTRKENLNFPRNLMMDSYFKFEFRELTVQYPPSVVPVSPTDNSYVFVSIFSIYGTNYYDWKCVGTVNCSTVTMSFYPYVRSSSVNSSFMNVGIQDFIILSTKRQKLNIIIDNISSLVTDIAYREPNVHTSLCQNNYCFHSLNIQNNILMNKPNAKYCYGEVGLYDCSSTSTINSEFLPDDIHQTFVTQNTNEYYFIIKFVETFFIDTSDLALSGNFITNGNSIKMEYIANLQGSEMVRVTNNSFLDIKTNNSAPRSSNCNISNCDYCELGICYFCQVQYTLISGLCTYCDNNLVYDQISKKCYPKTANVTNISVFWTELNTMASSSIVLINAFFDVKSVLPPTTSSSYTYGLYFNSIDFSNYNPILRTYYTSNEISAEALHLQALLNTYINENNIFYYKTNIRVTYTTVSPSEYTMPSIEISPERDNCFSDQLYYQAINKFEGKCVPICQAGCFYNASTKLCQLCPTGCNSCVSLLICMNCLTGYSFSEGICKSLAITIEPIKNVLIITPDPLKPVDIVANEPVPYSDSTKDLNLPLNATPAVSSSDNKIRIITNIIYKTVTDNTNLTNCSLGQFLKNNKCSKCQKGCIECTDFNECSRCDANYFKTNDSNCTKQSEILENQKLNSSIELMNNNQCQTCFQTGSILSKSCATCNSTCPCQITKSTSSDYFSLECQNATLNSEYFQKQTSNSNFYLSKMLGDFSLAIHLKKQKKSIDFYIDPLLILNTTSCYIDPSRAYNLFLTDNSWSGNITDLPKSLVDNSKLVFNYVIPLFSIISQPVASVLISFIQFNKIYFYFSLTNIRVGGIYQYINFNLYKSENIDDGFMIWPEDKYKYISQGKNMMSSKLCSLSTLFTYLILHVIAKIGVFLGKFLIYIKTSDRVVKIGKFVRKNCYKIDKSIILKYYLLFIVSLNFLLKNLNLTRPAIFLIFWISVLLFLSRASIKLFDKALNFLKNPTKEKAFLFFHLKSPDMLKKNKYLLKIWVVENIYFIVLAFLMFHFRKYKYFIIVASVLIIIIKSVLIAKFAVKVSRVLMVLRLCSEFSLLSFFFLTGLKLMGVNPSVTLFDATYVISNGLKIVELFFEAGFVIFSNRAYNRRRTQVVNLQALNDN